jgi:hypothetical protein
MGDKNYAGGPPHQPQLLLQERNMKLYRRNLSDTYVATVQHGQWVRSAEGRDEKEALSHLRELLGEETEKKPWAKWARGIVREALEFCAAQYAAQNPRPYMYLSSVPQRGNEIRQYKIG